MLIQKFEYLKSFENDLKQQLSVDKKYLPISKKLVVLLREINPFIEMISKNQQEIDTKYLQKSLNINKAYASNIENFFRSMKVLEDKNHAEIEKSQKTRVQKSHEINLNLKAEFEKIELKIAQANQKANEDLNETENNYKREISAIQKIMTSVRKAYQQTTSSIENEKTEAVFAISNSYASKIKDLDQKIAHLEVENQEKIEEIKASGQKANQANDETYLIIKNNYTQLSIQLNKKINEIKKKHVHALSVIEKEYEYNLVPVTKAIDDLKQEYQEAQKAALQKYSEKMNSLNVIFDIQKTSYEAKKERIIHESNEAITLFNSKLSAYRETIQKDKLVTARKMRDEIKSIDEDRDKEKHNRSLTTLLKTFDNDLNKQIIRTNKDILEKQREQQRRLFNHDQQHLKEINEWRLKKTVYEYEKKQEFARIDLNFHHNLTASEQHLKLLQANYNYQKDVLLLNHNKSLLPLEFQLAIAAAVQERELNLLGNDAHQAIAYTKFQENLLNLELKTKQAKLELEKQISSALFEADSQVLNVSIQLELEKEKIKRDFVITEQELRIELNQAILNKSKQTIQFELNQDVMSIESDREIILIENKFVLEVIKAETLKEELKREFVINEAKYKNQQRMSSEKASRFLRTYQIELEMSQEHTEDFMSILRMYYSLALYLKNQLIELYHLPSHPEVFKGMINHILLLSTELNQSLITILEEYQTLDQEFYIKKIEDLTGYKYMLKHEDTMNFYNQEISKITQKRAYVENDIKKLEAQFFIQQSDLERSQTIVNQLLKASEDIKIHESGNSRQIDLKDNHKLLANHEQEIKRLRKELSSIEHAIDLKHLEITPIDREIERMTNKQKKAEVKLEHAKHNEASLFYRYLNKSQEIYRTCVVDIHNYFGALGFFYQNLKNEVYVSDAFLTFEIKKLDKTFESYEKRLVHSHQAFMDLMLTYYHQNEKEQLKMIKGFKKSMSSLITSLNQTYNHHVRESFLEQKKHALDKDRQVQVQKNKVKTKLDLEKASYQKKLNAFQLALKLVETKITQNSSKQIQELRLLNDNQISIAEQYNSEFQQKKSVLEEQNKKAMQQIDSSIQLAHKNFEELEESVSTKNQVLLLKYQASHEKNIDLLKQKTFHYEQIVSKATLADEERTRQNNLNYKRMNIRREDELKNIIIHHKRYIVSTRQAQTAVLNKESRLLRKSHNFKMRMLHLS
ncbi:MAG: hypothetical protein KKH01_04275 [Firmicutes bacterium]|nr:hypothetical protein [Bacillota bacterium]